MAMNLQPVQDRVVVKITEEKENKTAGGIILPETAAKEKPQMAEVLAVGTDEKLNEAVKKGDNVIFAKYAGTEVKLNDENYLILKFEDILAIVKD